MKSTAVAAPCCAPPAAAGRERVRYFPRQMLTADDLSQEQEYLRARLRRHNRLLHGWGVVCGCEVTAGADAWTVTIGPGYVLTPEGEEVVIESAVEADLSRQGLDGNAAVAGGADDDPWCGSVRADLRAGAEVFVAVAYAECPARPVRVQPAGCGCDGAACEYSRVRDSFVVRALTQLPASYADVARPPAAGCPAGGVHPCPPCVADRWVILARVTVQSKAIRAEDIDNHSHRRYVATAAQTWLHCGPAAGPGDDAENLKQLLSALHGYHDQFGRTPADVRDAAGKPLLSWRVQLLPFLKQEGLYRQFKLDEPWDSDRNRRLIPLMPPVFRSPRGAATLADRTTYLAPLGPGLMWDRPTGIKLTEISDGTSNTIAIVAAAEERAVVWSRPEDIVIDQGRPAAGLVAPDADGFRAAMADGSVRTFNKGTAPEALWALFTRAGGEVVNV